MNKKHNEIHNAKINESLNDDFNPNQYEYERKIRKKKFRYLGLDSIIVVDPIISFNHIKRIKSKHIKKIELSKLKVSETIASFENDTSINLKLLKQVSLGTKETEEFNKISVVKEWVLESLDDNDIGVKSSIYYENNTFSKLTKEYKYVVLPIIVSYSQREISWISGDYKKIRKTRNALISIVLDLESGAIVHLYEIFLKGKPNVQKINALLYDQFFQLTTKKK